MLFNINGSCKCISDESNNSIISFSENLICILNFMKYKEKIFNDKMMDLYGKKFQSYHESIYKNNKLNDNQILNDNNNFPLHHQYIYGNTQFNDSSPFKLNKPINSHNNYINSSNNKLHSFNSSGMHNRYTIHNNININNNHDEIDEYNLCENEILKNNIINKNNFTSEGFQNKNITYESNYNPKQYDSKMFKTLLVKYKSELSLILKIFLKCLFINFKYDTLNTKIKFIKSEIKDIILRCKLGEIVETFIELIIKEEIKFEVDILSRSYDKPYLEEIYK